MNPSDFIKQHGEDIVALQGRVAGAEAAVATLQAEVSALRLAHQQQGAELNAAVTDGLTSLRSAIALLSAAAPASTPAPPQTPVAQAPSNPPA